jgi:hypothetical protein
MHTGICPISSAITLNIDGLNIALKAQMKEWIRDRIQLCAV